MPFLREGHAVVEHDRDDPMKSGWLKTLLSRLWAALWPSPTPAPKDPVTPPDSALPPSPADENPTTPPDAGSTGAGETPYWEEDPASSEEDKGGLDGGFLWKMPSNDGHPATLCPYLDNFKSMTANGEPGRYVGRGNGHRQCFRWSHNFTGEVAVVGVGKPGFRTVAWTVPDGAKRWTGKPRP